MEIKAILQKPYTENERMDFIVQYNHNLRYEIKETETELQALDYSKEELAEQEKARVQELAMTRSDFFDGTIQAWGVGQDELLVLIQGLLATLPIEDVKKLIAVNNFKNALNFYRKHDLFKILVNMPIQLTETIQVTITDKSLDKFFDEVAKGNKDTAWQYLPAPVMIPIEEDLQVEIEEELPAEEIEEELPAEEVEESEGNTNEEIG
jgi:hypothetical protein